MALTTLPITPRTQEAVSLARQEAGRLRHREVRRIHLVLGMIRQGECFANKVFRAWMVPVPELSNALEKFAGPADRPRGQLDVPFAQELVAFFGRANILRQELGHDWVGTDHFLMTLAADDTDPIAQILAGFGVTRETILRIFIEQNNESQTATVAEAELVQALARAGHLGILRAVVSRIPGVTVRKAVIDEGSIDEAGFHQLLQTMLGYETITSFTGLDTTLLNRFPAPLARKYRIIPLRTEGAELVLACSDPFREELPELEDEMGAKVRWTLATERAITEALAQYYPE